MKLYYSPGACSLAAHIALRETGLAFEAVKVEGRGQKTAGSEEYAQVTPKNYVPALRLDDGEVLTEGTAILPYVGDLKPDSGLAPAHGTLARYRLHEWLGYINSEVHKNFSPFFTPGVTDEQKAATRANLGKRFDFLTQSLEGREHLLGGGFTVADAYLFTVLGWCRYGGIDLVQWPTLQSYHQRIAQRPSVQAAMRAEGLIG